MERGRSSMRFTADFHIHSKYSRATSRDCIPEMLDLWARRKGLDLIGTGDFTHPAWREELREKLAPAGDGVFVLKDAYRADASALPGGASGASRRFAAAFDSSACRPRFLLSTEISSIYKKDGKTRKVHNVILLPDFEAADALSHRLEQIGNLHSDGRPILGLDSRDLLEITLEICPRAIFIPAHIWTPHFSLFGAYSGFDTIEACFGDLTPHIHALETGLSSDPPMNWRISALDRFTLVSNSDAHSPSKLAREANLFNTELSFSAIAHALAHPETDEFLGTLEFYPEEGKSHMDGHRGCKVCLTPAETAAAGGVCPVCGRRITVGVLHRVEELADRPEGFRPKLAKDFESIIPLPETIAACIGSTPASKKVQVRYEELLRELGPELSVLRQIPLEELSRLAGPCVAEGVRRLRAGEVAWEPGYDGEYGRAALLDAREIAAYSGQVSFFAGSGEKPSRKKAAAPINDAPKKAATGSAALKHAAALAGAAAHYGLNERQWEAVSAQGRQITVVAGPGTGKTRTLVYRIRRLIETGAAAPGQITAVTFTNKAAAELAGRLEQELGRRTARKVSVGTFHGLCMKLLRDRLGDVTLIDETAALALVEELCAELGLKKRPRDALAAVSARKNGLTAGKEADEAEQTLFAYYCERLEEYGALDYDDLILQTLALFEQGALAGQEREPFRRLLVDEFQDINPMQYRLVRAWNRDGDELFVIGDPDQAIYSFRGSDPRCFETLARDCPDGRVIRLNENYRSTPQILDCALPVIASGLPPQERETRRLGAMRPDGCAVRLLTAETPFSEALFIAKEINRMVGGIDMLDAHRQGGAPMREESAPRGFGDIAVLYRTHRQASLLEECFQKEGIPYNVAGRESYLTDKAVRTALAFFRSLQSGSDRLSAHLASAGLGKERMEALRMAFAELAVQKEKPVKLVDLWIGQMGLEDDAAFRRLRGLAACAKSMPELLASIALGQEGDLRRSGTRTYHSDAVTLMTLHGSKGLEFPVVFLCGVNEGIIPHTGMRGQSDPGEERRLFYVGMTRAQEELLLLTSGAPSVFLGDIPKDRLERSAVWTRPEEPAKQMSLF